MLCYCPLTFAFLMQNAQAVGAPKKGRPAFGDITNAAAASRCAAPAQEDVSGHGSTLSPIAGHRRRCGGSASVALDFIDQSCLLGYMPACRCESIKAGWGTTKLIELLPLQDSLIHWRCGWPRHRHVEVSNCQDGSRMVVCVCNAHNSFAPCRAGCQTIDRARVLTAAAVRRR